LSFARATFAGYLSPLPMDALETEIKEPIIESLMLDDVKVENIDSSAPLFVEGLGLDSIDALELAMAIDKTFGVRVRADDESNKQIFANVKNLAAYVAANRK
jgi:acyl carrier protein